jgi:hypothetical protein
MQFLMSNVLLATTNRRSVAVTYLDCRSYDLHYYRASIGRSPATFRKTSRFNTSANVSRIGDWGLLYMEPVTLSVVLVFYIGITLDLDGRSLLVFVVDC